MTEHNVFNLEDQYLLYLVKTNMPEDKMHPAQKKQLKETFMAACGQMLVLLRDKVGALDEKEAMEALTGMEKQVSEFFTKAMEEDRESRIKVIGKPPIQA